MNSRIWIVEMWNDERNRWEPPVGIGLTQFEGREQRAEWGKKNPRSKFRLQKYVIAETTW